MLKRAAITFTELALWFILLAILLSGYSRPAAGKDASRSTTSSRPQRTSGITAPLIPRDVLFGNPRRAQARLSHDGKWISFQAPVKGVLNIWVAPASDLSK